MGHFVVGTFCLLTVEMLLQRDHNFTYTAYIRQQRWQDVEKISDKAKYCQAQPELNIRATFEIMISSEQRGCTTCGSLAAKKWREIEKIMRKWRENKEMERDWLSTFPHSLSISSPFPLISSFSLHFLPLSPFPTSKFVKLWRKMLKTALLSRMLQKY